MDLTKRRADIIAEHAAMEKYDPYHKMLAAQGDRISERPIAFLCDDEVVVTGDCATKVREGLRRFVARSAEFQERAKREPAIAQALVKAAREATATGDLRVPQQIWNAYTLALGEVGVKAVLADGTHV